MKKRIAILSIIAMLVGLAFWLGAYLSRAHTVARESSYQAATIVHLLDRLHAGDTNRVAGVLDGLLDQNTVLVGRSLHRPLLPAVRNQIERVIPRIQEYRAEYSRTPVRVSLPGNTNTPAAKRAIDIQKRMVNNINSFANEVLEYSTETNKNGPTR